MQKQGSAKPPHLPTCVGNAASSLGKCARLRGFSRTRRKGCARLAGMDIKPASHMKPQKLTEDDLAQIAKLGSPVLNELAAWANKKLTCAHCRRCTLRCEVLSGPALNIGFVENDYQRIMALPEDEQPAAVLQLVQEHHELYHALRRCCFCGFCTATCQAHMLAPDRMREWRWLFMRAGLMPPGDSKLVMVDNEWHIFSAYRAIYNVAYPEFLSLADAAERGPGIVDTLFFPGCALVSYASELTRTVGRWLDNAGISWALSVDCCGSPLMSAGLFERAEALRQRILDQIRAAGIKRIITVCPGCGEEFAEMFAGQVDIVPLPEVLLKEGRLMRGAGLGPGGFAPLSPESLTFFDSCHDRLDNRHGTAIRRLAKRYLPDVPHREMDHRRKATLCCGAGGAVASYDPDLTDRRVWRVIDEARSTGAQTLVTMCPTCTYTVAQACLNAPPERGIENRHYLELLFGQMIDWPQVFAQLEGMWSGEYGPWLTQTFFS